MKKLLSVILISLLSVSCLIGCGSSNDSNKEMNKEMNKETAQETEIMDTTSTEVTEESETNIEETLETKTEETGVIILDNEYVTVERIDFYMDENRIYIKHKVENKTDHDICYYYDNLKVNGMEGNFGEPDVIKAGESIRKINALSKDNVIFENMSYSEFDNLEYQIWIFDATDFTDTSERDVVQWFMGNESGFNAEELTLAKGSGFASLTDMSNPNEETANISGTVTYTLDGVQYSFPTQVSELIENGWNLGDVLEADFDPGAWYMTYMDNAEGKSLNNVVVMNRTDSSLRMDECTVMNMTISSFSEVDFTLSNGLNLYCTESELKAICGESEDNNVYTCIISEDGETTVEIKYDSASQSIVSLTLVQSLASD